MTPIYKVFEKTGEVTLTTDSFQGAIDLWSKLLPGSMIYAVAGKKSEYLKSRESIKQWADWLMLNNYNRVERRIMNELMQQEEDGMKIVEPETGNFGYAEYLEKESSEVEELDPYEYGYKDFQDALSYNMLADKEEKKRSAEKALDFHGKFEEMDKWTQEQIINPKHYKIIPPEAYEEHPDGLEYMDVMQYALAHLSGIEAHTMGHVFKYSFRIGKKDAKLQDAKKIAWYANRMVEILEKESNNDK